MQGTQDSKLSLFSEIFFFFFLCLTDWFQSDWNAGEKREWKSVELWSTSIVQLHTFTAQSLVPRFSCTKGSPWGSKTRICGLSIKREYKYLYFSATKKEPREYRVGFNFLLSLFHRSVLRKTGSANWKTFSRSRQEKGYKGKVRWEIAEEESFFVL